MRLCLILTLVGCAGSQHDIRLNPMGGDVFSLPELPGPQFVPTIPCAGKSDAERFACIVAAADTRLKNRAVSGALGVVIHGELRFTHLVGTLGPDDSRPVTAEATFGIGSISKTVLAAAALTLAKAGKLDVSRPIADYLPSLKERPLGEVTAGQLLTHTSGLPTAGACEAPAGDLAAIVKRYADWPVLPPSTAAYGYSNLGYTILAAVLEAISGEPFEQVVARQVFAPAGMSIAGYDATVPAARVVGRTGSGQVAGPGSKLCRAGHASGGVLASVIDLARFAGFLLGNGPASVSTLLDAPVPTGSSMEDEYGYGLARWNYKGQTVIAHGGLLPHFGAILLMVPERRLALIALVNTSWTPRGFALRALDTLLDLPEGPVARRSAPSDLAPYPGCYEGPDPLGLIHVTHSDDGLHLDMVGPRRPLLPVTVTFFPAAAPKRALFTTSLGVARRVPATQCVPAP